MFNQPIKPLSKVAIGATLTEELHLRSDVPHQLARDWGESEQILPLLDGLDKVAGDHREACVEVINEYRAEHGWVQMAVCSRIAEYEALASRLRLPGAMVVQPLTRSQVEEYLHSAGSQLEGVRARCFVLSRVRCACPHVHAR